jgi:hypothetical protein
VWMRFSAAVHSPSQRKLSSEMAGSNSLGFQERRAGLSGKSRTLKDTKDPPQPTQG